MRTPAIPRSWLFVFSVAVALTGCTSLDAKTGAGGAAPGSIGLGPLMPDNQTQPAGLPNLDPAVTEGIQGLGADKALRR